ncbi:MAG: ABC transporter substrate-binding protein [Deltaproteobacteria bacterium HGW-Deltaproteobacteria-18]|nr:MAG: ABC transporter substrate-binding protein [Deltaproteobacteria bacterium HGW-Deltaproteobacteria-18]
MPLPSLSKTTVSVATSQKSPWPRLFGFAAVLLLSAVFILMTGSFVRAWAEQSADASTNPQKKWRVIYVEGGPYTDYQQIFAGTVHGLAKLGLIANGDVPVPANSESTREMWDWLCANAGGDRLEFLADGYYSANWDEKLRASYKADILRRIHERGDVDIILAFGTWAGQDMATGEHSVPTFSMSVTDAVDAGIVASAEDSGLDHVHAQVEPGRYERQVAIFHDVFKFRRMGVVYEDTPDGRSSSGIPAVEKAARELGIELVSCTTTLNLPDLDQSFENLRSCVESLSTRCDAIYLTVNTGMQGHRIRELLQPIIAAGIPSFSQSGPGETRLGVLMSLAQTNFDDVGLFEANAVAKVLDGTKPRDVNQIFEGPLGLAINLKMAMLIGWNPPFEILAAVDEIHQQIPDLAR